MQDVRSMDVQYGAPTVGGTPSGGFVGVLPDTGGLPLLAVLAVLVLYAAWGLTMRHKLRQGVAGARMQREDVGR